MPRRTGAERARSKSVETAIGDMDESHLMCRDFGHSWRPWTAEFIPQRRQYVEALVCTRCTSVRRRLLDQYGHQLGNAYTYADGYQVHGVGRLTGDDRDAVRLAGLQVVLRITGEEPAVEAPKRLRAV